MYAIAIDGPAVAGKTTTAKLLAKKLSESFDDFHYVDTGAMYRAIAFDMIRRDKTVADIDEVLNTVDINIELRASNDQRVYLSDEDVTDRLRTDEISMLASDISALAQVRKFLLKKQRDLAKQYNVVMEGRDIGSVILPNANVKFYLTATLLQRAARRAAENRTDVCRCLDELELRDNNDKTRAESPLVCVDDAVVIDSTPMTVEEVVGCMLRAFYEKLDEEVAMRARTADGSLTGIGRKVYAIWPKLRLDKNGYIRKSKKELVVVQATVNSVTFVRDMNDEPNWYGTASAGIPCTDSRGETQPLFQNVSVGPYNAFVSEAAALAHIEDFKGGMEDYPHEPPIPRDVLTEKLNKFRHRFDKNKED